MSSASPKHGVNPGFLSPVAVVQRYEVCQRPPGRWGSRCQSPFSPDMVPWVVAEGFGVPYSRERSEEHMQGRREGERERSRWRSLDLRFLIAHCSCLDPVNSWRVVQDMELRLHYGRSLTPARFLHRISWQVYFRTQLFHEELSVRALLDPVQTFSTFTHKCVL